MRRAPGRARGLLSPPKSCGGLRKKVEPHRAAGGPSGGVGPSPPRLSAAGEPRSLGALAFDLPRAPPTPPVGRSAAARMDGAVAPQAPGAPAVMEPGASRAVPPEGRSEAPGAAAPGGSFGPHQPCAFSAPSPWPPALAMPPSFSLAPELGPRRGAPPASWSPPAAPWRPRAGGEAAQGIPGAAHTCGSGARGSSGWPGSPWSVEERHGDYNDRK